MPEHTLKCPRCGAHATLRTRFDALEGIAYVCDDCGREIEHRDGEWVERVVDLSYAPPEPLGEDDE